MIKTIVWVGMCESSQLLRHKFMVTIWLIHHGVNPIKVKDHV